MTKRVLSLTIALILPVTLLCGCSGKRLTPEEYKTAIESAWKKYMSSVLEMTEYFPADADEEGCLSVIQKNKQELEELLDKREEALDDFKKINPPEEYGELHKKLIKAEDAWEYENVSLIRDLLNAKTAQDVADYIDITEQRSKEAMGSASDIFTGTTFPSVYVQIIMKLQADGVGENL